MSPAPGTFIISLDLELNWGMFDAVSPGSYDDNLRGVHEVTPRLLGLFREYDIAATWATVGLLMAPDWETVAAVAPPPAQQPQYGEVWRSSYAHQAAGRPVTHPELYFAPQLIKQISETPRQELASHTFSHFYCAETHTSPMGDSFAADCAAMQRLTVQLGHAAPTSLVFPRNQWTKAALGIARAHGITAFRGTETHWLYRPRTQRQQRALLLRFGRALDTYINLSGYHTSQPTIVAGQVQLPASRFLRPYAPRLAWLEPLRLQRIKRAMTHAARTGTTFHLWWHPHNYGVNQTENLTFIQDILEHYTKLKQQYGMQNDTMQQVATAVLESSAATTEASEDPPLPKSDSPASQL